MSTTSVSEKKIWFTTCWALDRIGRNRRSEWLRCHVFESWHKYFHRLSDWVSNWFFNELSFWWLHALRDWGQYTWVSDRSLHKPLALVLAINREKHFSALHLLLNCQLWINKALKRPTSPTKTCKWSTNCRVWPRLVDNPLLEDWAPQQSWAHDDTTTSHP